MRTILNRLFLLMLFTSLSVAAAYAQESYFLHTIEKGQSLYSIASMYGITPSEIVSLNPDCEEKIYSGQSLKIPQKRNAQQSERFHTIQPGETLYKLTTLYQTSAKEICQANPGLSADNFRIGQVIRIPSANETGFGTPTREAEESSVNTTPTIQGAVKSRCKEMHKVKRSETIFSISREYKIAEQELIAANPELKDGMKKGQFLCIPHPSTTNRPASTDQTKSMTPPTDKELFLASKGQTKTISTIQAAIVLPLVQDKRTVEYYEGFLIAVDSLKRKGVSVELYVYNCEDDKASLNNILAKDEMKQMDVIFGPAQSHHTTALASFAKKNDIRLVIPFSSKEDEVFNNPLIYQINTPQSYLYSEVYEHFTRQFSNANVIFLEASTTNKEKAEFIKGLKQELAQKGVTMKRLPESATAEALKGVLRVDKENIFIPTSGSNFTLLKILPQLTLLVRENKETNIHLFGYPEWQTYTKDHLDSFFELDTYFYSSFYTNNLLPAAINFNNAYHKWYTKDMAANYPKYGMLGFDTGFFFLSGLSKYGSALEKNLSQMDLTPIQTGFKFQRVNNWGGFINKKVFFVRFTKNYELVKLDFE